MRWSGRFGVAVLVVLAACTGGSRRPDAESTNSASASSQPAIAASASVTVQGDAVLTAALTKPDVRCSFPDVDGPSIALLSTPPGLVFRFKVQQGKVTVLVSDTTSPDVHERDFVGTGVTSFDPSTGARVDSPLTEVVATAGSPGTIGELTAVKASIDCAGQDPGVSTVTLDGDTPQGPLANAGLETARVECNPSGDEVVIVGIVTVGGTKAFMDVGLRPDGVSVQKTVGASGNQYLSPPGAATVTDTGARVDGDATEQGGTASHVLHVRGEATCGTPVS